MIDLTGTPALNKAVSHLQSELQSGKWQSGERIPTIAELAKQTGIGQRTMVRAVALLRAQGALVSMRGGGLRIPGNAHRSGPIKEPARKIWQIKRAELESDILNGAYARTGRLPGFKQLEAKYGLSFRTMRKVLRSMAADRALRIIGKSYLLPGIQTHTTVNRVLFVTQAFSRPPRSALNPAEPRVIGAFELECLRRDIAFEIIEIDFADRYCAARTASSIAVRKDMLGCIVDIWRQPVLVDGYNEFLGKLIKPKFPIAILDEYADFDLKSRFAVNPLMQVFRIEGRGAGAKIARSLLNLGHRKIGYFTASAEAPWSQLRYNGIADQFSKAGFDNAIELMVLNVGGSSLANTYALSGFTHSEIKKSVTLGRTPEQAAALLGEVVQMQAGSPKHRFPDEGLKRMRAFLDPLRGVIAHTSADSNALALAGGILMDMALRVMDEMIAAPIFEKALEDRNITAWVCASDLTAHVALEHLAMRNIAVPSDLSVVSFDNLPGETLERRLTSFDFNVQGFAYRMMDFVARPPRIRGMYRHEPIEIEGGLVVRGTMGRARNTTAPH
jgi:DNA-binding transcriptional regulator YhcF (GntR family)